MRGEFPNLSPSDSLTFTHILQDKENIHPDAYTKFGQYSKYGIYSSPESKLYIIIKSDTGMVESWCKGE